MNEKYKLKDNKVKGDKIDKHQKSNVRKPKVYQIKDPQM